MKTTTFRLLLIAALFVGKVALAKDTAAARQFYEQGTRYFDLGQYADALESFKKAYWVYEDPVFIFNIAQCYRQLDNKKEALRFYRTYLRKVRDAPNVDDVKKTIAELEAKVADTPPPPPAPAPKPTEDTDPLARGDGKEEVRVEAIGAPQNVSVEMQSKFRPACTTPCSFFARPGPLLMHLDGTDVIPTLQQVNVPPGGVELRLKPASTRLRHGSYALIGVGAGLLTLAIITLPVAAILPNDPSDATSAPNTNGLITGGVFAVVGTAATVAGLVLYFRTQPGIADRAPLRRQLSLGAQPNGVAVRLRF
jgi:hypothetical protein